MTYFPYSKKLQEALNVTNNFVNFKNGNFGLWFNKFVPLKSERDPKPSDFKGNDKEPVEYYEKKYTVKVDDLLESKHLNQFGFCKTMESLGYQIIVFHAKLKAPLITGIGESHPHEIGMVFDHTLGVPYIPASGIKGVSRLNFIIENIKEFEEIEQKEEKEEKEKEDMIDLESNKDFIKSFGSGDKRGNIIFLDAYSIKTPLLKADIMTPHYGDYYSDDTNRIPPADNQNPIPIKFLTVKEGTEFVFRALIRDADVEKSKKALKDTLENGVGAKTALGYGCFEILEEKEPACLEQKYLENLSPEEKEKLKEIERVEQTADFIREIQRYTRENISEKENELMSRWERMYKENPEVTEELFNVVRDVKGGKYYQHYRDLATALKKELPDLKKDSDKKVNEDKKRSNNNSDLKAEAKKIIDRGFFLSLGEKKRMDQLKNVDRKLFKKIKKLSVKNGE